MENTKVKHAKEYKYKGKYRPLEEHFIKYLNNMLSKKKIQQQGWMNPTNKYLAENFTDLKGEKVAVSTIANLWSRVKKEYLYVVGKCERFIYTRDQERLVQV